MRRFLLVLTVISLVGWFQPARPQAQPPIVVKVEMPSVPQRDALGYFQALGPLFAALAAVSVGLAQWSNQRKQLEHALFDKRYTVYAAVSTYLPNAIRGEISPHLNTLRIGTTHVEFLFGPDITTFLAMIVQKSIESEVLYRELNDSRNVLHDFQTSDHEIFLTLTRAELQSWFIEAQRRQNDLFRPYLDLGAQLPWYLRLERDLNAFTDRLDKTVSRIHS